MPPRQPLSRAAASLNAGAIHLLRGLRAVDAASGLTPARLSALSVVVLAGPTPLGRLAATEGVASPTMTRIVDGLEGLGLVRRQQHELNGRIVLVAATAKGAQLLRDAATRRHDAIVDALGRLEPNEREAVVRAAPALEQLPAGLPSEPPRAGRRANC